MHLLCFHRGGFLLHTADFRKKQNERLGRLVRSLREKRGLTLRQLGRETGLDSAYLSRIERGMVSPSDRALRALCISLEAPELYTVAGRLLPDDLRVLFLNTHTDFLTDRQQQLTTGLRCSDSCQSVGPYSAYWDIAPKPLPDIYRKFDPEIFGIPQEWIGLPPLLRSEVVSQYFKLHTLEKQTQATEEAERDADKSSRDTFVTTAYTQGVITGMIRAYELLLQTYQKHGLFWLLAGFLPAEECRFLADVADVYEAFKRTSPSSQTIAALKAFLETYKEFACETGKSKR